MLVKFEMGVNYNSLNMMHDHLKELLHIGHGGRE